MSPPLGIGATGWKCGGMSPPGWTAGAMWVSAATADANASVTNARGLKRVRLARGSAEWHAATGPASAWRRSGVVGSFLAFQQRQSGGGGEEGRPGALAPALAHR